jgi:hypothetical protein
MLLSWAMAPSAENIRSETIKNAFESKFLFIVVDFYRIKSAKKRKILE